MKKRLLKTMAVVLCLWSFSSKAQTYAAWGHAVNETNHMYDSISNGGDSLKFQFTNTGLTAYGNARLVIYYEGNFGDWFDYFDVYDENLNYFGGNGTNPPDCSPEDSTVYQISASDINTWAANGSIFFTVIPNSDAGFCAFSRVRMRLVYDYCASGVPLQFATPAISNAFVCSSDAPYTLTGTPAGGTFSGPGVTGSLFNPANLAAGSYQISYTALDAQACTTTGSLLIYVKSRPEVNHNNTVYACNGSTVSLATTNNPGSVTWFSDAALSNSISATNTFVTPALGQNTTYYVAGHDKNYSLGTTTLEATGAATVDVNNVAGDDHGGIIVTQNYVFLNGDNNCVRADLNLSPSSLISLPIRDGMFSDLHTGHIWTLYNTTTNTTPNYNMSGDFTVNALRGMDDNLLFTNEYIYLTTPVVMGQYSNGIFSGSGSLGLYSGSTQHFYVVDLDNGGVSDFGYNQDPQFYGSETWSDWGVLESSCGGVFSVLYHSYVDEDIHRLVIPTGAFTSAGSFSDLGDMASMTLNPWNNRWYWHYENGYAQFGGDYETLGYADAPVTEAACPGNGLGCPTKVVVTVPANVTLSVPLSNVCLDNSAIGLSGGAPAGGIYSGVGVGTNTAGTVFYPSLAGPGVFTVNYTRTDVASGCVDAAAQTITVNGLPAVTAVTNHTAICLNTGATVTLTADGAGTSGTYSWSDGLGSSSDVSFSPTHDQTYVVTGTDANGCSSVASVQVLVSTCTGINTVNADAGLIIYPNPSNGEFTVSSNQAITLTIFNELGQQVNVITLNPATPQVKVNNLSNGVYFITGSNANGSVKQKIVVAK